MVCSQNCNRDLGPRTFNTWIVFRTHLKNVTGIKHQPTLSTIASRVWKRLDPQVKQAWREKAKKDKRKAREKLKKANALKETETDLEQVNGVEVNVDVQRGLEGPRLDNDDTMDG